MSTTEHLGKKGAALRIALGFAIAGGVLGFLFSQVTLADLSSIISEVSIGVLLLVLLLNIITNILRAYRFQVLLSDRDIPLFKLVGTVLVCNAVTSVLPAGIGHLSYPALFRRNFGVALSQGVPLLLLAMIFDLTAICCIFLVSSSLAKAVPAEAASVIDSIGLAVLVVLVVLVTTLAVLRSSDRAVPQLQRLSDRVLSKGPQFAKRGADKIIEGLNAVRTIKSSANLVKVVATSVGIWGCMYLVGFILMRDLGVSIDVATCFTGQSLTLVTTILPIQGIGGFGSFEGAWAAVFILLGISEAMAISSGLIIHLILFVYQGILGLAGGIISR